MSRNVDIYRLGKLEIWKFIDEPTYYLAADIVPTSSLLEAYVPCLQAENPFATLLTFHRIWRMDKR